MLAKLLLVDVMFNCFYVLGQNSVPLYELITGEMNLLGSPPRSGKPDLFDRMLGEELAETLYPYLTQNEPAADFTFADIAAIEGDGSAGHPDDRVLPEQFPACVQLYLDHLQDIHPDAPYYHSRRENAKEAKQFFLANLTDLHPGAAQDKALSPAQPR